MLMLLRHAYIWNDLHNPATDCTLHHPFQRGRSTTKQWILMLLRFQFGPWSTAARKVVIGYQLRRFSMEDRALRHVFKLHDRTILKQKVTNTSWKSHQLPGVFCNKPIIRSMVYHLYIFIPHKNGDTLGTVYCAIGAGHLINHCIRKSHIRIWQNRDSAGAMQSPKVTAVLG